MGSGALGSAGRCHRGLACALLVSGCSFPPARPLPADPDLARRPSVSDSSVLAAASSLHHPLLPAIQVDPADGLSPDEAAALALVMNPSLAAARATPAEAAADVNSAGLFPNPSADVAVEDPYGAGSEGLVQVLNLALTIETRPFVTRGARIAAAEAEERRVELDLIWQEWQVAQAARLEATRLAWLERRTALARAELENETEASARLEQAFDAGDATADQLGVQIAAREKVRADLIVLEQTRTETRSTLLALLGQPDPESLRVAPAATEPYVGPPPDPAQLAAFCLASRIDLQALRAAYDGQEAKLRQAVLEQIPNVTVGFARNRDESEIKFLGGFVTLGLPIFDRSQGAIALASATRERLGLELEARATEARSAVDEAVAMLDLVRIRLPEISRGVEPLVRLEETERIAEESGDVDWLAYETIRLAALDQQLQQAALAQLAAETRIGLETACPGASGRGVLARAEAP